MAHRHAGRSRSPAQGPTGAPPAGPRAPRQRSGRATARWRALAAVLIVLTAPCAAHAQGAGAYAPATELLGRSIRLRVRSGTLERCLHLIAGQLHITVLADGDPLRSAADFDLQGSAADVLTRVADEFDYLWSEAPGGSVLLRKRFRNPDELPQMSQPELSAILWDAASLLPTALPLHQPDTKVTELYRTLTQQQMGWLTSRRDLSFGDLQPGQQDLARTAISNNLLRDAHFVWQAAAEEVACATTGSLQWRHWRHAIMKHRDPATDGNDPDPDHVGSVPTDGRGHPATDYVMRRAEGWDLVWVWSDGSGRERSRVIDETDVVFTDRAGAW